MAENETAVEILWRNIWVRTAVYGISLTLLVVMLWHYRESYAFVLQVALISFFLAYLLNPLVEALGRLRIHRAVAVILVYLVLLQLLVLGTVLTAQVIAQIGEFAQLIPEVIDRAIPVTLWFDSLLQLLGERFGIETPTVPVVPVGPASPAPDDSLGLTIVNTARDLVTSFFSQAADSLQEALRTLISTSGNIIATGVLSFLSGTLQVALILLSSAYFLYDYPRITSNVRRYVPTRWLPLYRDLGVKADLAVGGYFRGQVIITAVLGVMIWIGLTIAQVPLALALSFVAAVFNLIPYLGPIIGTVPAVLLGLTVNPWSALGALVVFVVANQLEGNLLSPFILARATNLHPVTVLLSILAGAGLFGLLGALLAIPVVAFVKLVLEDYLLTRPAFQRTEHARPGPAAMPAADFEENERDA
jgi:predicted PurR-regulated permease PerM